MLRLSLQCQLLSQLLPDVPRPTAGGTGGLAHTHTHTHHAAHPLHLNNSPFPPPPVTSKHTHIHTQAALSATIPLSPTHTHTAGLRDLYQVLLVGTTTNINKPSTVYTHLGHAHTHTHTSTGFVLTHSLSPTQFHTHTLNTHVVLTV